MRKMRIRHILPLLSLLLLTGCDEKFPLDCEILSVQPAVFPDVKDVTIPVNIAPLTFKILEEGDAYTTRFSCGNAELLRKGKNVVPKVEAWERLLRVASGNRVKVEVFRKKEGKWVSYQPFYLYVAEEEIDPYISYRLISPSYVAYEKLTINQRNLTSYEEKEIYNNMLLSRGNESQCINCHSYKNYRTDNMQFHVRQHMGGTLFVIDGKVKKVNLKTDSIISAGVYPAFNPIYNVIAYSVNTTGQTFHTLDKDKIEVQDFGSDLILYDYEKNELQKVEADPNELEIFPCWSPDGETLYFGSAHYQMAGKENLQKDMVEHYQDIHYSLYKKRYNPQTKNFSSKELVFDAAAQHKSATLPRISPDGRYLLFGMGDFGCFHVWHNDADLYVMDLQTDSVYNLKEANSSRAESYHSWSSNGRWILFVSRRDDGGFSRLYISYFDKEGNVHKPFELPQRDADFYPNFYRSYNVPEFMTEPVHVSSKEFARHLEKEAVKATFVTK